MTAERLPDDDLDRTREQWVEGEVLEGEVLEGEEEETEPIRWSAAPRRSRTGRTQTAYNVAVEQRSVTSPGPRWR
jgi:hypothetical protein